MRPSAMIAAVENWLFDTNPKELDAQQFFLYRLSWLLFIVAGVALGITLIVKWIALVIASFLISIFLGAILTIVPIAGIVSLFCTIKDHFDREAKAAEAKEAEERANAFKTRSRSKVDGPDGFEISLERYKAGNEDRP